jgi:hypothetical protein
MPPNWLKTCGIVMFRASLLRRINAGMPRRMFAPDILPETRSMSLPEWTSQLRRPLYSHHIPESLTKIGYHLPPSRAHPELPQLKFHDVFQGCKCSE